MDKKHVTFRVEPQIVKKFKFLAVEHDKTLTDTDQENTYKKSVWINSSSHLNLSPSPGPLEKSRFWSDSNGFIMI